MNPVSIIFSAEGKRSPYVTCFIHSLGGECLTVLRSADSVLVCYDR